MNRQIPINLRCVRRVFSQLILCGLSLVYCGCDRENTGSPSREGIISDQPAGTASLELRNLSGEAVDPFQTGESKLLVFLFLSTDCPISNRYAPEIRRLAEAFKPCAFWLVYPNRDETASAVKTHTVEYQLDLPVLRDPEHRLVQRSGARVTPEAAVFSKSGELLYLGRIDNRSISLSQTRPEATEFDLREALDQGLRGERIRRPRAAAIGCSISEAK